MVDTVPGQYGRLFSGLIWPLLSEFRYTAFALHDEFRCTPSSPRNLSTQSGSASPDSKNKKLVTRVKVNQVMDIVQGESAVELVSSMVEEQLQSYTSRPSSSKFSDQLTILGSNIFLLIEPPMVDSARSDNAVWSEC